MRLRAAIAALPADHRSAIALFYLEDMSVAEIAVALTMPAGTVKTRLMHARRKLRAALEGDRMMRDLDAMIDEALDAEERELFAASARSLAFLPRRSGVFGGSRSG